MLRRVSVVNKIRIVDVSLSSVFHIGDSVSFTPLARVFAVRREYPLFFSNEGNFEDEIYSQVIPKPPDREPVSVAFHNENPTIHVRNIRIIGIAASSLAQIGSIDEIDAVDRVKNIRQLESNEENQ
ncbi:spore germination protein GerPE [Bacillus sp. SM2101]|uniref:spore germination protein GerPE n=1 Tax=Bacillus sp. SM2101 TaxID=2805366 RepID=UPI001BDF259E|nr:spore germination protein GerPE [Bacillus sp. SM2101]